LGYGRWPEVSLFSLAALIGQSNAGCSYKGVPAYMMSNGATASGGTGSNVNNAGRLAPLNIAQREQAGGTASVATRTAGEGGAAGSTGDPAGSGNPSTAGDGGSGGAAGAPAAESVTACQAHAAETVCDGVDLYHCVDMGGADAKDTCGSAARCRAGISTGRCGICDPGAYRCTDARLESCSLTGEWQMEKTCASAELCAQGLTKHSCDPMACEAGSFDCSNGQLRPCKADLTDFDEGTACDPALCDNKAGRCNECQPSTATCSGTTVTSCSGDGKKSQQACTGSKALCQNGKCVECVSASDCKPTSACRASACNTGTGACGTGSALAAHTACKQAIGARPGKCDYLGNCLPCVDDTDCPASQQCNVVLGCQDRPPLQLGLQVLAGSYTVTIAPGYRASIRATTDIPSGMTVTASLGLFRTVCSLPNSSNSCTVPAATMAQTLTINGPSAQACGSIGGVNEGLELTLGFEDQSADVESATCDNPTITISAIR
jgi:hypothetical protein